MFIKHYLWVIVLIKSFSISLVKPEIEKIKFQIKEIFERSFRLYERN